MDGDTKTIWVGTSWKMNKTLPEAEVFARELAAATWDPGIQPFVIPPFTVVREVKRALKESLVLVGAQNMHWEDMGAWTGEISPPMLVDCGLDMVEIGHSERREHFGETDFAVGLKTAAAVRHGLLPIVCVGERLEDKETGRAAEILERQVRMALGPVADAGAEGPILLAYEPVWAIGDGGLPASPDYASERMGEISEAARAATGRGLPCLYGGSVSTSNCQELVRREHVDGLFVGRAAWDVRGFLEILALCGAAISGSPESR